MTTSEGPRVLVVDDHRLFADVLAERLLDTQTVAKAVVVTTLSAARSEMTRWSPDLILLDRHLDRTSGLDLLVDLVSADIAVPRPRVLMLSATAAPDAVIAGLRAGVDGWTVKDDPFTALVRAVEDVLAGLLHLSPRLIGPVISHLLRGSGDTPAFVRQATPRQHAVLELLVAGRSRAQIASELGLSVHTVRSHIERLLTLADVHSTFALIVRAQRQDSHPLAPPHEGPLSDVTFPRPH